MEMKRDLVYLAALLHDIGKFYQRAANAEDKSESRLTDEIKKIEGLLLPNSLGRLSHRHALWTAQFIVDNLAQFNKLADLSFFDLSDESGFVNLASGHHLPDSSLNEFAKIIKRANSLASGMDRESEEALKDEFDEHNNDEVFRSHRMISIFETIGRSSQQIQDIGNPHRLPVEEISLSKSSFANTSFHSNPDYSTLWNKFLDNFRLIQSDNIKVFNESLLALLHKYASSVPSSTKCLPDVSLFDHSKVTAAIALCLYDIYEENAQDTKPPFLLVGGDLSGIQPYIYQIVSKYAGKNLKGRSFYLRLLSDAVIKYILKETKLYKANIIYNSGGSFYLIAPNTEFVKAKLNQVIQKIETKMFEAHGTTLFLAIDAIEMSEADLMNTKGGRLSERWGELFLKRDQKKSQKFSKIMLEQYSDFFAPSEIGLEIDNVTGEGIVSKDKIREDKEVGTIKLLTQQQILLGKRLRSADYMVISDTWLPFFKDKSPINPVDLGFYFYLLEKDEIERELNNMKEYAANMSFITLNSSVEKDSLASNNWEVELRESLPNSSFSLEFYGGNTFDGLTFDKFCNLEENEDSFKRLGVLRMDVDNLGSVFQSGIDPERASLTRFATLSRSFDYFFSGYLNTIQEEVDKGKENSEGGFSERVRHPSFIVYSGGDDLFIVAAWDTAIKLAKKINHDFKEFTCGNPSFSVSGGIAIVTPKFPIIKAAKHSEVEEDKAKSHSCKEESKNAISFMQMPLNWDREFLAVEKLKDDIVSLINDERLTKSFISKLQQHAESAGMKDHKITNLKTYWMVPYDLGRMIGRKEKQDIGDFIENCKKEICGNSQSLNGAKITSDYHALELWAFAARWAELEIRTGNTN